MTVSDAQRAANDRYDAREMLMSGVKWRKDEFETLNTYCQDNGIPRNGFIRAAVMDAIRRGWLPGESGADARPGESSPAE